MNFRQTIHGFRQHIWRGMFVGIEIPVNLSAFQPEISAEINHLRAVLQERHRILRGDSVRQGQEHHVRLAREQLRIGFAKAQIAGSGVVGKFGKNLRQALTSVLARSDRRQFGVRMSKKQADQFLARVTGSANNSNSNVFSAHLAVKKYTA
jgi:hypothetical protein